MNVTSILPDFSCEKIMLVSENNEENENYDVQDSEILNTKEATADFCFNPRK